MRVGVSEILSKVALDFASLGSGNSQTVVLAEIDACGIGDATLGVRVHANSTSGTSTMVFGLYSKSYSPDDPDTEFVSTSPAATVRLEAGTAVGTLLVAGLLPGFGSCFELRVTGTRVGADVLDAEVSAEIVARRGVAAPRRSLAETLVVGNETGGTDLEVTSGDELRPSADNAVDVGTPALRFRTVYAGTSVLINDQTAARIVQALQVSTLRI
jgi:hypothetical protein